MASKEIEDLYETLLVGAANDAWQKRWGNRAAERRAANGPWPRKEDGE